MRHAFTLSYIYELPFGRGRIFGGNLNGAPEALLGNWQVNGIIRARAGLPLAFSMATDQSGTGLGNRPNITCDPALASDQRSVTQWFNTACFAAPTPGTFGNAPRTMLTGPGLTNVDLSLFKTFRIHDERSVQFRAEIFNLFNPATSVGGVGFGQITSTINPARQVQFALKLAF